jgi:hypothetical protein
MFERIKRLILRVGFPTLFSCLIPNSLCMIKIFQLFLASQILAVLLLMSFSLKKKEEDFAISDCTGINEGLVAHYKFTNGSLKDLSGKNNHITYCNAKPTFDRFGKANNAFSFNGLNSYMSVPNSASLNPSAGISIMAIVKVDGFYDRQCHANNILSKGWNDWTNGFYYLRFSDPNYNCNDEINPTKEYFMGAYGDLYQNRAAAGDKSLFIQKNKWYHVVFTCGKGFANMYVNGHLIHAVKVEKTGFSPNSLPLTIGKHGDPAYPYWFTGVIDEIRIYRKALCFKEVGELYKLRE